jgi:hypothetical protein
MIRGDLWTGNGKVGSRREGVWLELGMAKARNKGRGRGKREGGSTVVKEPIEKEGQPVGQLVS